MSAETVISLIPNKGQLDVTNMILARMMFYQGEIDISTPQALKDLMNMGPDVAKKVLPVGSQIIVPWKDVEANVEYQVPLDVKHYGEVTLKNGTVTNGMYLGWHYATPFDMQFDKQEAFRYFAEGLAAGTYHFSMGLNWGSNVVNGKSYQFTLTQDIPAGGQLAGIEGAPDQNPSNWRISSYASASSATAIETVTLTEGSDGTDLGTFTAAGDANLNSIHRVAYGYNRWSKSAYRQWLNSREAAGSWWTPQHEFDRPSAQASAKAGFLTGFGEDFLSILSEIQVTTALNTVTDSALGDREVTNDLFFLPSLEQIYCTPQLAGAEGEYWQWWKEALERDAPAGTGSANKYDAYKNYGINNKTSPVYVRLRSAGRGSGTYVWYLTTAGYASTYTASHSVRALPACVVTQNQ